MRKFKEVMAISDNAFNCVEANYISDLDCGKDQQSFIKKNIPSRKFLL